MNAATSITDNDMLRARNMALVGYSTIKERPFSLARYLASNVFDHGKIITPDEEKINFSMVTKNDLLEAAAMIFKTKPTDNGTIVEVRPAHSFKRENLFAPNFLLRL
jgi:predicted Zn-dependent peptidase